MSAPFSSDGYFYADGSYGYMQEAPAHTSTQINNLAERLEQSVMQNYGMTVRSSAARDVAIMVLNGQYNITSATQNLYYIEQRRRRQSP